MRLMIASDIHGSSIWAQKLKEKWEVHHPDQLILLGDLLYHGPRNTLPDQYETQKTAEILNSMKENIVAVRGNCDAEVDQMLLEFPILAEYAILWIEGKKVLLTHGHQLEQNRLPKLQQGDILMHGHTHIPVIQKTEHYMEINPGSVSIPKGGFPNSYMLYENKTFKILDFENTIVKEKEIEVT